MSLFLQVKSMIYWITFYFIQTEMNANNYVKMKKKKERLKIMCLQAMIQSNILFYHPAWNLYNKQMP